MYVIMKTICPPGYHYNGFVTTHALGHMMYGYIYIYIYIYILLIYYLYIYNIYVIYSIYIYTHTHTQSKGTIMHFYQ